MLEQGTVELLREAGVGDRMRREGLVHHGIELQFDGERHRIPLSELAGGRSITIYGQTEVVKDLIAARIDSGLPLLFEVADVSRARPRRSERPRDPLPPREGDDPELECDVDRRLRRLPRRLPRRRSPPDALRSFEREYPFGWLGILAAVAPSNDELVYATTSAASRCSACARPSCAGLYVQCRHDEDIADWSDERIWEELQLRLGLDGWTLDEGPILEKGITGMRSFVVEPMQHGRLFLAGDAAHIVPPTGAKGLNLAIADVRVLAEALVAWYRTAARRRCSTPTRERCLRRVWRAEHFSWWMTSMLHRSARRRPVRAPGCSCRSSATSSARARRRRSLAENYVGLELA